jgi:transmembrane sensor
MSGGLQETVSVSAVDIQTRAADWIFDRHDSENWSAGDQVKLDAWLAESLAHRVAYVRLETMLNRSTRLVALRRPPSSSSSREKTSKTRSFLIGGVATIAVTMLVGIGASAILLAPKTQTYTTALGEHKTVTLADGSRIELNTNTVLRIKTDTHERTAWLDTGEAYFQIKHNTAHPFVVDAAGYRVRDLGTEFSVRNDPRHLEVALIQGRVRFESANKDAHPHTSDLIPGDIIVATADNVSLSKKSKHEMADALAWRQGLLVFQYATLADAAAEFNRYNTKKLVIADVATAHLTIVGKFPANDIELFGQVAKSILGVRVEVRNDAVVISR